jgi:hypothetical protein
MLAVLEIRWFAKTKIQTLRILNKKIIESPETENER